MTDNEYYDDFEADRKDAGDEDEDFFPEDYGRISCSYCDNTPPKEDAVLVRTDKYYPYSHSKPPDNNWACPRCIKELRREWKNLLLLIAKYKILDNHPQTPTGHPQTRE